MDSSEVAEDTVDGVIEEWDLLIAKKAVENLTSDIVTVLHAEIGAVLDKARGYQLIGPDMYNQSIENSDPKQVSRKYLAVAMGHCVLDPSKLPKFISIFEEVSSLDDVATSLKSEMKKLSLPTEAPLHSTSVTSDTPTPDLNSYPFESSRSSLSSYQHGSFTEAGVSESPCLQRKDVSVVRNLGSLKGSIEEDQISGSGCLHIPEPSMFLEKGRRSLKTVSDSVETTLKKATNTYEQVKESMPLINFSEGPPEVKKVSESLNGEVKDSTKYEVYLALMKKRQNEMDELEAKYDKERQELKRKFETVASEESASLIKEEEDLKSRFSKDAQKYAEVGQLLEDQVQFQTETSKVETLQVAIQYEKKINELNKEIGSLKDVIADQKDEIAHLKLSMKDQKLQELEEENEALRRAAKENREM